MPLDDSARPLPRLALNEREAAAACSFSTTYFVDLVARGIMPMPRVIGRRKLWLVDELQTALAALPRADDGDVQPDTWADYGAVPAEAR